MNLDAETTPRRFPTLVQLCQRVAGTHVEYITSLGDDLSYTLVKPILQRCNAEQLLRLQQASPHLQTETPEIWKDLCYSTFPLSIERYSMGPEDAPRPWKDHYFYLREAEAKRLEEAGTKLRNQRLEAEERKKEREVKITDRVPPPKRQRTGWGMNPQPKTLFQKTRSEASKLQKNMYNARIMPPMPANGKNFRVLPNPVGATLDILPPSNDTTRVTVNNVIHRRPTTASASTPTSAASSTSRPVSSISTSNALPLIPTTKSSLSALSSRKKPPFQTDTSTASPDTRPLKPQIPPKRDPMASLFVPKHRPFSQRP
ncbi:Elongin-A [Hypsizygus marmoreus]|uniref:Elongin-A n=1 Tax=Hypsizygus marmoreus TaxID=39966 RepID=A0A369JRH1_HYPMA|nr:Elongin-A [Hypsizygus marmoreus]